MKQRQGRIDGRTNTECRPGFEPRRQVKTSAVEFSLRRSWGCGAGDLVATFWAQAQTTELMQITNRAGPPRGGGGSTAQCTGTQQPEQTNGGVSVGRQWRETNDCAIRRIRTQDHAIREYTVPNYVLTWDWTLRYLRGITVSGHSQFAADTLH